MTARSVCLQQMTWLGITWSLVFAALCMPHAAQAQNPTEHEEATDLLNFSQFVQWPSHATEASNSFNICVLGQDPFGPALDTVLARETIAGKPIAAKRVPTPQDSVNCQILFISSSENGRVEEILAVLRRASVLTVSDLPQFVDRGGMLQFLLLDGRVRFQINLVAAERAGLTLGSELLKLAVNVKRTIPAGD